MSSSTDGPGADEEDTVLRPARDPAHPDAAVPPLDEDLEATRASAPAPQAAPPATPGFIDRVPFGRPAVPDQAPIQRFDQRPRFDSAPPPPRAARPAPPVPVPPPAQPQPQAQAQAQAQPQAQRSSTPVPAQSAPRPQSPQPRPAGPAPSAAPPGLPPGIDATGGPRRRGLLLPALAFGCAMLLLLGIGGGVTGLWLLNRESDPAPTAGPPPESAPPGTEPGVWEPLAGGRVPSGGPAELRTVLAENPLTEARLEVPADCSLPALEGGLVPEEELPALLEAGAGCLESAWSTALDPVGITFEGPRVVLFEAGSPPPGSACAAERFTGTAPVVCTADDTLYWPPGWDPGFSNTSAAEAPGLYMWHLSYSYTVFALAAADLDGYYSALQLALADDPEQAEQAQRRYALQISCLSSAAAFQLPQGVRPAERVEDFVTSQEAQAAPTAAGDPSPSSRAAWVRTGRDSRGMLGECATWTAGADAVA